MICTRTACVLWAAVCLLLPACSLFQGQEDKGGKSEPGQAIRSKMEAMSETTNPFITGIAQDPNAQKYNVMTSAELEQIDNGSDEELIWTDPDNPDADIAALDAAFENRAQGKGWINDLGRGMKLARLRELPLIVWLHDSVISPKSKTLARELLETDRFDAWAAEHAVRVKIDTGAAIDEQHSGKYSLSSIKRLQNRFGVHKRPALIVFSPQGKIVERIDGYDGFPTEVEIGLRNGVELANKSAEEYRAKLLGKGYREWKSKRGEKLIAKLQRYDEQKQMVYLREAGGRISRTKLSRFCQDDIDYLDERAREGE